MKAIILASGPGIRLFPLTKEIPKTLVEVNGVSLLERIIQSLMENNITDIIITTGYLEEKIKEFIKEKFPELKITFVKNPIYDRTNYIYSLWLARDLIGKDDIILLHGDLFFEPKLMGRIVKNDKSCALTNKSKEVPEKDFKARIKDGLITEIGVNIFGDDARFLAPLYKFSNSDFRKLLDKIEEFIKDNKVNCYAEDAFNLISDQIKLHPLYFDNEFCMEIDDFDDLEKANNKNFVNIKNNYPKVSIIVLNWENYKDTKECLESLGKINYLNYEIIVVDNGSKDGSTKEIQKEFPQYIYIYNNNNLGFTGGNNVGMKYAVERGADYLFFINNDMIVDKGFLEPLVEAMKNEKAGLVGPAVYYYFQREKIYSAGEHFFWRPLKGKYKFTGELREVDSLAAPFLIKKEVIDKIGYFYEPYFLNLEETDYCFRTRKAGFKIFCEPKSKVWHKIGGTLKRIPALATYYYCRNILLFIKRNAPFYTKYLLYFYYNLYLILRFIEKLFRRDKEIAFAIRDALIDFWRGNFGKKNKEVAKNFSKILIINPGGIGDLVAFIPALKILRQNFPSAKIDLFIAFSFSAGDLFQEQGDLVNRIFKFSLAENNILEKIKFIYKLRKEKYDLSIMMSGVNPFKGGILSFLIGAKTRVGERREDKIGLFYTHTSFLEKQKHTKDSNIDLLKALGLDIDYPLPLLFLEFEKEKEVADNFFARNNLENKTLVGFHPGAGKAHWYFLWDKENFIKLGQKILENYKNSRLIIFGGPSEKELCKEIKNKIGEKAFLADNLYLRETAALINSCQVFVVSDSGLGHLAATTGTNIISIFGPSDAERLAPFGPRVRVIKEKCNHLYDPNRIHTCLKKITPDLIFNEVEKILKNERIN